MFVYTMHNFLFKQLRKMQLKIPIVCVVLSVEFNFIYSMYSLQMETDRFPRVILASSAHYHNANVISLHRVAEFETGDL